VSSPIRREGPEIQASALMATCGQCWAYPNITCKMSGLGDELHFARYQRANVKGVVSDDELARALAFKGEGNYVTWGKEEAPGDHDMVHVRPALQSQDGGR
jgi:hypothetical protein